VWKFKERFRQDDVSRRIERGGGGGGGGGGGRGRGGSLGGRGGEDRWTACASDEVKSHFDGDRKMVTRMAEVLSPITGPRVGMSFDRQVLALRELMPELPPHPADH